MKEHKKSTIVIACIFVSIVILLLTYILIVAYSYDDIGSKYNTDWYNEKYNISFTSSNKLFPYALIHMLMGTKLILKWIIIVEVSLLEKKVFLQVKKPVKNIVILIIMHLVNMIITMVY